MWRSLPRDSGEGSWREYGHCNESNIRSDEKGAPLRTFSFLRRHKLNLVIALLLLMVQAYSELTLPSIMSGIVDTGISRGGIESVVPDWIAEDDLRDVELFLTPEETSRVESLYRVGDDGVLEFTGSNEDRAELEEFLGQAEMLAFQLGKGIDTEQLLQAVPAGSGRTSDTSASGVPVMAGLGESVDISDIRSLVDSGAISADGLVEFRTSLVEGLGDYGEAIVSSQAIEFVKQAYGNAGIDVGAVQARYLIREGALMLGCALVAALCAVAAAYNASRTAAKVARDLRHEVYERVLSFSPVELAEFSEASLITRATNDIQQIQMVLVMCMRIVLFAPCMGIGAVMKVIGFGSTGLQWIIVSALVVISCVIGALMALTMPKFRRMQDMVDRNNLVAREIITGIMPIRSFGRTKSEEERFDEANRALTNTYLFTNRAMSFMMPTMMLVMNVTSVAIVWFGGQGVDAGTMQVGDLMAYMNYTIQVIMSFMIITMVAVMLPRADIASERVQSVLSTDSSIVDPAKTISGPQRHAIADGEELPWTGVLSFNDVSFTYPGASSPTVEHVTFTVRPGQTLGIIGSTGVGKSTLVQLIPRLYDVTGGSVTIDGVDVRRMGLEELRGLIGYVPQKGMLFSGDIAGNISYGDPEMDRSRVERAARIAQAEDFIMSKPEGYDSPISQGGTNVSGGQRQRLAIARALAIEPKILVFDDSFSALDYKTDAALRAALAREARESAVVIVAQRIATIMHADEIIVLDDGRVVGQGTHGDLLRTCDTYREIAMSQLSASELGIEEGEVR